MLITWIVFTCIINVNKGNVMRLSSFFAVLFAGVGLFPVATIAQQGELVISSTYIKAGCSGWAFLEGGSTGAPSGAQYPRSYQITAVTCDGGYVAKKTQSFYENGSLHSCRIDLMNTSAYVLSSNTCTSFEVRELGALLIPATPAYAYMGNVGGCGAMSGGGGACPAPEYWVSWPSVANASSYQYQFVGAKPYSGSTGSTNITIPYGYNPTSGKVRACNANNQCSSWRTVTTAPQ